jgi:hypothetical protein
MFLRLFGEKHWGRRGWDKYRFGEAAQWKGVQCVITYIGIGRMLCRLGESEQVGVVGVLNCEAGMEIICAWGTDSLG